MSLAHLAIKSRAAQALVSLLLLAISAGAQDGALSLAENSADHIQPGQAEFTVSKEVNEVNMVFTVSDKRGHLRNNLAREDFQFFDNQQTVGQVRYFHRETLLPMRVGLLIDVSDSIAGYWSNEQKAADIFLHKVLRKGVDEAFVATFDSKVHLIHDWSSDPNTLFAKVRGLPKPEGETALYDALIFACDKVQAKTSNRVARQVVIVITDGVDTASKQHMFEAQQSAARSEVVMFALSTNDLRDGNYPKGEAVLDLMTRNTGGSVLPAREKDELARGFHSIETALRSQYALGYVPDDLESNGRYHVVDIRPLKGDLVVHGRKGYYAPRTSTSMK